MSAPQPLPVQRQHAGFTNLLVALDRLDVKTANTLSILTSSIVFVCDWFCAPSVPFGPYYLIPIALAAWRSTSRFTLFLVFAASLARTVVLARLLPAHSVLFLAIDVTAFMQPLPIC